MQPIKAFYSRLCHVITHMLSSSFNLQMMGALLLFSQVFESKGIVNLEQRQSLLCHICHVLCKKSRVIINPNRYSIMKCH
jgi:hypothetical protein